MCDISSVVSIDARYDANNWYIGANAYPTSGQTSVPAFDDTEVLEGRLALAVARMGCIWQRNDAVDRFRSVLAEQALVWAKLVEDRFRQVLTVDQQRC